MKRRKIFTGKSVTATYTEQELPEYAGNPMIEALPPIMGDDMEVLMALQNEIDHGDHCRAANSGVRRHIVRRLRQFWFPQPDALLLERRLSTLIREGYVYRNPMDLAEWNSRHVVARERLAMVQESDSSEEVGGEQTSAHSVGMSVIGLSGVGKTTTIQRVLSTYPQRIVHDVSEVRHPVVEQLVWLLVTCPEDGGTPALCRAILSAFDAVMGTQWAAYFTERGASAHAMRTQVVSLAHSHALGLLVIDEIQLLKSSRSGNARTIMGFLLALMNDLEVPVLLVGTPEAAGVLNPSMQNARRFIGNGCMVMDRLHHSRDTSDFKDFVEMLWDRSNLRDMKPFDQLVGKQAAILDTLYRCTGGIHDLVVKMFMLGQ
jgi:hypothetical protein